MPREFRMYLWDIELAITLIGKFSHDKTLPDYLEDDMLRAAIERKFEIVGEALTQMRIHHPVEFAELMGTAPFIGFRNVLVHQYAQLIDSVVWAAIKSDELRLLRDQIRTKLELLEPREPSF